jgi:MFS family permease
MAEGSPTAGRQTTAGLWVEIESGRLSAERLADSAGRAVPLTTVETVQRRPGGGPSVDASSVDAGPAPVLRLRRADRPVLSSLDGGGRVLQRYGRTVIVGSAVFMVPMFACNVALSILALDTYDELSSGLPRLPELLGGVEAAGGAQSLLAFLSLLVSSLTAALVGAYCTRIMVAHHTGSRVSMGSALKGTLRVTWSVFVGWLVSHWWLLLGAWLLVAADTSTTVLLAIFVGPLAIVCTVLSLFVAPVVVSERVSGLRAARRAWSLARLQFGAGFGFVCGSILVGGGLRLVITYLPVASLLTGLVTFGPYVGLAQGIASQVAQLVTVPLIALATAQFYLQVRIRAEGADISLRAARAWPDRAPQ